MIDSESIINLLIFRIHESLQFFESIKFEWLLSGREMFFWAKK